MIQRIQTVYLLISVALLAVTMFLQLGAIDNNNVLYPLFSTGLFNAEGLNVFPTWGVVAIGSSIALISFVTIFLFKKRKLQIKLGYIAILLVVLFYITFGVYVNSAVDQFSTVEHYDVHWIIALPGVAIIFLFLAIRSVKADEKLVRSLDRIR